MSFQFLWLLFKYEVGLNKISSLILVVMILLVKIIGHVNIFVFLFLMITLTVFILILLILIFLKRFGACFANWRQVRPLKMYQSEEGRNQQSRVQSAGICALASKCLVHALSRNHLLSDSLHGGRVIHLLFGQLGFSIHRLVNTA